MPEERQRLSFAKSRRSANFEALALLFLREKGITTNTAIQYMRKEDAAFLCERQLSSFHGARIFGRRYSLSRYPYQLYVFRRPPLCQRIRHTVRRIIVI